MHIGVKTLFAASLLLSGITGAVVTLRGAPPDTLAAHQAAHAHAQIFVSEQLGQPEFLDEYHTTQISPQRFDVSGLFFDVAGASGLQRYTVKMELTVLHAWRARSLTTGPAL